MESQELLTFLIQAVFCWVIFKIGQISGSINTFKKTKTLQPSIVIEKTKQSQTITVEEINGIFYAYDGNDFLAQGSTPDDLGRKIADRFPNKYYKAKVEIKA